MSQKPVENLADRFLSIALTLVIGVIALGWAAARIMKLMPLIVFGAAVFLFLRWQRR